jgi:hypothetical protein
MVEAFYGREPMTADPRAVPASGNQLLQVLILPQGKWLLLGRAKVHNPDGSDQASSLHLRADNAVGGLLDWVDNFTKASSSQNMKVQGFIDIRSAEGAVVMTCHGYKVSGSMASLIAVRIDDFGPGRSDHPKVPPTGIPPEPPK